MREASKTLPGLCQVSSPFVDPIWIRKLQAADQATCKIHHWGWQDRRCCAPNHDKQLRGDFAHPMGAPMTHCDLHEFCLICHRFLNIWAFPIRLWSRSLYIWFFRSGSSDYQETCGWTAILGNFTNWFVYLANKKLKQVKVLTYELVILAFYKLANGAKGSVGQ